MTRERDTSNRNFIMIHAFLFKRLEDAMNATTLKSHFHATSVKGKLLPLFDKKTGKQFS